MQAENHYVLALVEASSDSTQVLVRDDVTRVC